jgi:hypothetical protein
MIHNIKSKKFFIICIYHLSSREIYKFTDVLFDLYSQPLTDSSKIESTSIKEDKFKEDEPVKSCTNIPLCEALKTINLTTDDQ